LEVSTSTSPAGNKTHKYADACASGTSEEHRTNADLVALARVEWETRNKRNVRAMGRQPFAEAHFATFPSELPETCIKAGCPLGGIVLDPFFGAGTTGFVAERLQRACIGIELNPASAEIARRRIVGDRPILADVRVVAPAAAPAPVELKAA
jgi:DNA modification methylase